MTPSGVSSPTEDGGSGRARCGGDSGGATVGISGGDSSGGNSGDTTVDISGGKCGGAGSGDDKPESIPAAASVGGSSSKRVVLDLPPPR
jgi:hypothetical protein